MDPLSMRDQVTLREVAARAGVSVSTASNALTGSRAVGASSIERVLLAATELGYRRNELARSLRTGLRQAIGLVIPDVTNPFWAGMVGTIERLADAMQWSVTLRTTDFDPRREAAHLARLVSSVDGILLFSTGPDAATVAPLVRLGVPVVACDEAFSVPGVGGVHSDNEGGARWAAYHLVDAGGTVFGLLEGPSTLTTAVERGAGFVAGLRERGIPADRIHRVTAPYSFEGGREGVRRLLDAAPDVDALFACTDNQAIGAILEAHDLGRAVPDDLLVCGFDDISWSSRIAPSVTTIRQDATGMAERAFRMLVDMVSGAGGPRTEVLPVQLIERGSTRRGPAAGGGAS